MPNRIDLEADELTQKILSLMNEYRDMKMSCLFITERVYQNHMLTSNSSEYRNVLKRLYRLMEDDRVFVKSVNRFTPMKWSLTR